MGSVMILLLRYLSISGRGWKTALPDVFLTWLAHWCLWLAKAWFFSRWTKSRGQLKPHLWHQGCFTEEIAPLKDELGSCRVLFIFYYGVSAVTRCHLLCSRRPILLSVRRGGGVCVWKNSTREWITEGKRDHWVPSCRLATTKDCYFTQMNHFYPCKMYFFLCYSLQFPPLVILAYIIFSSKQRLFIFYCWVTSLSSRNTAHSLSCGSRSKHLGIRFFAHELRKLKLSC